VHDDGGTRQAFEVVLMDLDLPRLDGVEAARQLRAMLGPACPPIVPLTGSVSADSRRRCAEAGMAGFLAKPVSAEALRQTLCDVVRADRSPRS
ncbi:MAG: response regulator, partial [Acidobacteria bacterium]|nr:response regulator [Acidobacteriota bacterium]